LSRFIQSHPDIASECSIHQLHGKLGLKFDEYALVVPYLKKGGGIVLKLIKSGEDWMNVADFDELYGKRVAAEDVSGMSDDELETLLDRLYHEANPDAEDDEEASG